MPARGKKYTYIFGALAYLRKRTCVDLGRETYARAKYPNFSRAVK